MPFVIAAGCIDVMDKSCLEECPVDCIYEGDRKLYIHPDECIDCGACEPVCPQDAITPDVTAIGDRAAHVRDNRDFFLTTLPGRDAPLGQVGGAAKVGRVGVDTPLIATAPAGGD
jgi:NAD-dependent dihydropyrimidine dehydrogenase PreA subunit